MLTPIEQIEAWSNEPEFQELLVKRPISTIEKLLTNDYTSGLYFFLSTSPYTYSSFVTSFKRYVRTESIKELSKKGRATDEFKEFKDAYPEYFI